MNDFFVAYRQLKKKNKERRKETRRNFLIKIRFHAMFGNIPSSIYSWFTLRFQVVLNFYLNFKPKIYIFLTFIHINMQLFSADATIFKVEKPPSKEILKLIFFPYCSELPKGLSRCYFRIFYHKRITTF